MNVIPPVVILGLGNILLGDEGVGVHVIRELERSYSFPPQVELLDGGTTGVDLLPAIERAGHIIVIDCVHGNFEPGTIVHIVPEDLPSRSPTPFSLHDAGLMEVLALAKARGYSPRIVILGIQPKDEGFSLKLTRKVGDQVPKIVELVLQELDQLGFSFTLN